MARGSTVVLVVLLVLRGSTWSPVAVRLVLVRRGVVVAAFVALWRLASCFLGLGFAFFMAFLPVVCFVSHFSLSEFAPLQACCGPELCLFGAALSLRSALRLQRARCGCGGTCGAGAGGSRALVRVRLPRRTCATCTQIQIGTRSKSKSQDLHRPSSVTAPTTNRSAHTRHAHVSRFAQLSARTLTSLAHPGIRQMAHVTAHTKTRAS